jgi:hypothetical protein
LEGRGTKVARGVARKMEIIMSTKATIIATLAAATTKSLLRTTLLPVESRR